MHHCGQNQGWETDRFAKARLHRESLCGQNHGTTVGDCRRGSDGATSVRPKLVREGLGSFARGCHDPAELLVFRQRLDEL